MSAALLLLASCGSGEAPPPARGVLIPTGDGAAVMLHHHPADGPPVLLVHGIASNARFWDLTPERSLARALTEAGHDTWLLDLRGHGAAVEGPEGARLRPGWTIDDYGRWDVPAAIAHIREQTGYDRVGYIGHSMGGMVAAAYVGWHGDDHLAALAVLGSPLDFRHPEPLLRIGRALIAGSRVAPGIPVAVLARAAAPFQDLPFHGDEILFNPENLDEPVRKLMYRHGTSAMTRGELGQLGTSLTEGRFVSADGSRDHAAALSVLDVPLLVVAGRADAIAPPDRVEPWTTNAASAERHFEVLGRANGHRHDYGHLDMVVGVDAPTDVHPLLIGFLDGRWENAPR